MDVISDISERMAARRLEIEEALIAEALDEIARGLFIESDAVDAWIESIGTGRELPPPFPVG